MFALTCASSGTFVSIPLMEACFLSPPLALFYVFFQRTCLQYQVMWLFTAGLQSLIAEMIGGWRAGAVLLSCECATYSACGRDTDGEQVRDCPERTRHRPKSGWRWLVLLHGTLLSPHGLLFVSLGG